ncbi:MAG TPA: ATP-binding protein [Streptosporangiaceae bacterium]
MVRLPGAGRHAKASEAGPPPVPALPIRSAERRRWSAELTGPTLTGLVVHGVGGIGKSVLAAQIAARVPHHDPDCAAATLTGEVTPDMFLAAVATAVRRHPLATDPGGTAAEAIAAADRPDLPWTRRMSLLRQHVLGRVPVLLVLDNFDDNLTLEAGTCTIRDPELVELLTSWASRPHRGRLLITCRHQFAVPDVASPRIAFRHLGPLSRAGAIELATSLPALNLLGEHDLDLVWRLLGGHPRAMEYLDRLLACGDRTFAGLADRLTGPVLAAAGPPAPRPGTQVPVPTELTAPVAETAALAASGVLLAELFGRLSPAAQGLLVRASAYRAPIGRDVLLLPVGQYSPAELTSLLDEVRASGLLEADPWTDDGADPLVVSVHPATATGVHELLATRGRDADLADAHHRAAEYWRWRLTSWPQDRHAQREARFHLLRVSELEQQAQAEGRHRAPRPSAGRRLRRRLTPYAVATVAVAVTAFLTAAASGALNTDRLSSSVSTAGPPSPAVVARDQAATWVAGQVSRAAIVSCDPAMCTALQTHGVPAGDLLVLRSAASDPLGSDVVLATPAIRAQFGARLASVYAPQVIASFGTGAQQIEVRSVAPDGARAFTAALAADQAARQTAGRQLLRNSRLTIAGPARTALRAGQVDDRLLVTLAALAAGQSLHIVSFGGNGPGAGAGTPLRTVQLTAAPAALGPMLTFVRAQRSPYLAAHAAIIRPAGGPVLTIEFAAPSPAGLLNAQAAP